MYTAMKSIFEDKNSQEDLFFKGPGKDLDVRHSPSIRSCFVCVLVVVLGLVLVLVFCSLRKQQRQRPWWFETLHLPPNKCPMDGRRTYVCLLGRCCPIQVTPQPSFVFEHRCGTQDSRGLRNVPRFTYVHIHAALLQQPWELTAQAVL